MVVIRKIQGGDCEKITMWIHDEFSDGSKSYFDTLEEVRSRVNSETIPYTFVAEVNGELVGTASLVENGLKERPNLGPWLANVYVSPNHRGSGIGKMLSSVVSKHARNLGYNKIYLWTVNKWKWYEKQGWEPMEEIDVNHEKAVLASLDYRIFSECPKLTFKIDALGGIENIKPEVYIKSRKQLKLDHSEELALKDIQIHSSKESLIKRRFCYWCKTRILNLCKRPDITVVDICKSLNFEKNDFSNIFLGRYMEYSLDWYIQASKFILKENEKMLTEEFE